MPQWLLDDFRVGVDTRRAPYSRPAGALSSALNVHVTSAAEIEKRKAFVQIATLPAGCFGLGALADGLYSFGSIAAPSMPGGVQYLRLEDPLGVSMTDVVDIEAFDGELFVIAAYGSTNRAFYDGTRVKDLDPDVCRFRFEITGGTASAGVNEITSITVNGVEILDTDVDWATSHEATAAAVAAQINSFASVPNYTAYVPSGTAEVCIASPHGTISTGQAVVVTTAGNVVASPSSGVMDAPPANATSARTAGAKIYVTAGANVLFSAALDAPNFSPNSDGGGFFNASTHSSGALTLVGSELFYDNLVVFGSQESQRWQVRADDTENANLQTFRGAGLIAPRAALSYLDGPTLFLGWQGVREIQTRDEAGRSSARPDSKAIDRELRAHIKSLAATERERAFMVTEPEDDRVLVFIKDKVFVRSWYPGWQAPAWTTYELGFTATAAVVHEDKLYVLSDARNLYLYGGTTGEEYDTSLARVRIAYATARAPTTLKGLSHIDMGIEGVWTVRMALDPDDEDFAAAEDIGVFTEQTFDLPRIPLAGQSTHVSLEISSTEAAPGKISVVGFQYKQDESG